MQKYEAHIDYCPQCKGVWLDRGEIDKIANVQRGMKTHITRNIIMEEETMMMMTMTMITLIDAQEREDLLAIYLILIKNLLKFYSRSRFQIIP